MVNGRERGIRKRKAAVQAHVDANVLLFEGMLTLKKQQRFFRLQNETLSCYSSAEDCHQKGLPANKGMWDLHGCSVAEEVHIQPLVYVESETGGFRLELEAANKVEAGAWATRLEAGVARANKRGALNDGKMSKKERQKALETQEEKMAKQRKKAEEEEAEARRLAFMRRVLGKHRGELQTALCGSGAAAADAAAAVSDLLDDSQLSPTIDASRHCVLLALGNAYTNDVLVRAVVRVCFASRAHPTYLDVVMSQEIDRCTVDTTLFRTGT